MNVKIKEVVKHNGHQIKPNGKVFLSFKAMYSEITNSIQQLQLLNNDIKIKARIPGGKPFDLGIYRISKLVFDDDGESTISFSTLTDFAEMDNLNQLVGVENLQILMESDVEVEDETEEED